MNYSVNKAMFPIVVFWTVVIFGQDADQQDSQQPQGKKESTVVLVEETGEKAKPLESRPDDSSSKAADELIKELLMRLKQRNVRDPFAPDESILDEQKRGNNEFVEVGPGVTIPEITLVGVVSMQNDAKGVGPEVEELKVASIKIEEKVYFVRKEDRLTINRNSGNLVVQIQEIRAGSVEVKLGTLSESVIIR